MKKSLILACMLAFSMSSAIAVEVIPAAKIVPAQEIQQKPSPNCHKPTKRPDFKKRQHFDEKLKLTETQKKQANEIRMKGHEEMKPIMEKIKAKRQEADAVRRSKIAVQMQQEKIEKIDGEIKELRKQAHELKTKNMKEFESILTNKQKKELAKIKKEGRKRFENKHKKYGDFEKFGPNEHRPGFGPGFGPGPVIPQPPLP